MNHEIELVADGNGVAVIGSSAAVEAFLAAEGLPSRDLRLRRLGTVTGASSAATQAGAEIAAQSGRWVKLTEKSAAALKHGELMKGSENGVARAIVTKNGRTSHILEIAKKPGGTLANPAALAGAAGLMAQLAMQQTMDEITDYLAQIDKKVDDILRAQKDGVLADMLGVDLVVEEALTIREQVGRVSDVTWSKVQATTLTIARTQAYALRQLDLIAENLERDTKLGDVAKSVKAAEGSVQEWLAVLAQCFRLQDGIAVLELDRVLDATPTELDLHRSALQTARSKRTALIAASTARLLARMDEAATTATANSHVLRRPGTARSVVTSSNQVTTSVLDIHERLGIGQRRELVEGRRWAEAASEVRSQVVEKGADGLGTAKRLGTHGARRTRSAGANVAEAARQLGSARSERARRDRDEPQS